MCECVCELLHGLLAGGDNFKGNVGHAGDAALGAGGRAVKLTSYDSRDWRGMRHSSQGGGLQ